MAYDAGMLTAVAREINAFCRGGARVDKVLMPASDEVVLLLHAARENRRLTCSASPSAARLTFTSAAKENPLTPPAFCMLLRKYLLGAALTEVRQAGYERVARLCFSARDEMGYEAGLYLVCEIMGKYSNLMLLDKSNRILGVLRPVDFTTSRLRQVLPGMTYELPPPQAKTDPRAETVERFAARMRAADPAQNAVRYLTDTYLGTSAQVARQIVYAAAGDADLPLGRIRPQSLAEAFCSHHRRLLDGDVAPTLVTAPDGRPLDFAYAPVTYFENAASAAPCQTFAELFDRFYGARERAQLLSAAAADVEHLLKSETARVSRRREAQQRELADAQKDLELRRQGDLLTANLWRIRRGDAYVDCIDYTDGGETTVRVPLDPRLSPSANAQRLYKKYNKAKTAQKILTERLAAADREQDYLASVAYYLEAAQTSEEIDAIRAEMRQSGYLKTHRKQAARPQKAKNPPLITYVSPGGYRVCVGANNLQNEYLTFTLADRRDLWFHVQGMPGSHVVLFCGGAEPDERDYTFAATVAAYHSRAKGKGTAVDYTRVRELRRVPGAPPGYVIYHTHYSAYVDPSDFDPRRTEGPNDG